MLINFLIRAAPQAPHQLQQALQCIVNWPSLIEAPSSLRRRRAAASLKRGSLSHGVKCVCVTLCKCNAITFTLSRVAGKNNLSSFASPNEDEFAPCIMLAIIYCDPGESSGRSICLYVTSATDCLASRHKHIMLALGLNNVDKFTEWNLYSCFSEIISKSSLI